MLNCCSFSHFVNLNVTVDWWVAITDWKISCLNSTMSTLSSGPSFIWPLPFRSTRNFPGTHPSGGTQASAGAHRLHHIFRSLHAYVHHQREASDPGPCRSRGQQGRRRWGAERTPRSTGGRDGAGGTLLFYTILLLYTTCTVILNC